MCLWPPEHGKTTLLEDRCSERLARFPNYRITVGSEGRTLSGKVLYRVKNRMEVGGPYPEYVRDFGPFTPQLGSLRATRQSWGAYEFHVARRSGFDERDFSMQALGFTSNVAGTRTDLLAVDDVQSLKSLAQTSKIFDQFTQDWLSRPGEHGVTWVNGTRVGDGDFYEELEDHMDPDILTVIRFPAIVVNETTGQEEPLFKERYTLENLDRQRRKVGEQAWARNYMQTGGAKGAKDFTAENVDPCLNPLRSMINSRPPADTPIWLSLDPALGSRNCVGAFAPTRDRLYLLGLRERTDFARNEDIIDDLEDYLHEYSESGLRVSTVIIEAKNFQQGLARDERLKELAETYEIELAEHLTGANKYASDIGVAQMARDFAKQRLDLPWADDEATRRLMREYRKQLFRWKPYLKGNKLRQDMVMVTWFAWIRWKRRRHLLAQELAPREHSINTGSGLLWTPTPYPGGA